MSAITPNKQHLLISNLCMIALFIFCVIAVNWSVISFDFLCPEQIVVYIANLNIKSFGNILDIYLYPKMLQHNIPFFRPTGHFVMYQLFAPWLGWQNSKGLIVINLVLLAITGYVMLKIYELLFPRFKLGGCLAFSVYLMHPALMLPKFSTLHFEFGLTCALTLSLYFFIRYCNSLKQGKSSKHLYLSILFFMIAGTFKESAIMLGPVLACYFLISLYHQQNLAAYFSSIVSNSINRQIIIFLFLVTVIITTYLSMSWPSATHSILSLMQKNPDRLFAMKAFLAYLIGWGSENWVTVPSWCGVYFTTNSKIALQGLLTASLISMFLVFRQKNKLEYKKSLVFLAMAIVMFLIIPAVYNIGLPWHANLPLIFLCLMMGFGTEYLCRHFINNNITVAVIMLTLTIIIGMMTITINHISINAIVKSDGPTLALGRNAIDHPPEVSAKLNKDTLLVIEDSALIDAYLFGGSDYPYSNFQNGFNGPGFQFSPSQYENIQNQFYVKTPPVYSGLIFKWAYRNTSFQEMIYPFKISQMNKIPDYMIYIWLKHANNIICLGYDAASNWHDRSDAFKKNLSIEGNKRKIIVNAFLQTPHTISKDRKQIIMSTNLDIPEYESCQYVCDQNKQCKAFAYVSMPNQKPGVHRCLFYKSLTENMKTPCEACTLFTKSAPAP